MRGTVYLTDGFERLDLPGRTCVFALEHDWVIRGQRCSWLWPHDERATVAGAEIVMHGAKGRDVTWLMEVDALEGPPQVVKKDQEITFTPSMTVTPDKVRENA